MKKIIKYGLIGIFGLFAFVLVVGMFSSDEDTSTNKDNEIKVENTTSKKNEEPSTFNFPLKVVNDTGVDIYKIYTSEDRNENWEEDVLGADVLYAGETLTIDFTLNENSSPVWDFRIEDSDGNYINFYDVDFSDCSTDGGTLVLEYDGNQGTATIS